MQAEDLPAVHTESFMRYAVLHFLLSRTWTDVSVEFQYIQILLPIAFYENIVAALCCYPSVESRKEDRGRIDRTGGV